MDRRLRSTDPMHFLGQNLIRIILASYFMAAALGLIVGPTSTPIFATFLDPQMAQVTGGIVTFVTAFLLLCGTQVRAIALLLGLQTFWASYLTVFGPFATGNIDIFWRDVVLVAALMMTYLSRDRASQARAAIVRPRRKVRPVGRGAKVMPQRVAHASQSPEPRAVRPDATQPAPVLTADSLIASLREPAAPAERPASVVALQGSIDNPTIAARLDLAKAVDAEIDNIFSETGRRLTA